MPGVLVAGIRVCVTEKHVKEGLSGRFVRGRKFGNDTIEDADNQARKHCADYLVSVAETIWSVNRGAGTRL